MYSLQSMSQPRPQGLPRDGARAEALGTSTFDVVTSSVQ
jgi:hypothetical protein